MGTINNLAESVGDKRIVVTTIHIQRVLSSLRRYLASVAESDEDKAAVLQEMDRFTFDEVMLAARLIATVETVHGTDYLWSFIEPLVAEGRSGSCGVTDDTHIRLLANREQIERKIVKDRRNSTRSKIARAA
jgi:hypothetical protein